MIKYGLSNLVKLMPALSVATISEFLAIRDEKKTTASKANNGHRMPLIHGMKVIYLPVITVFASTPDSMIFSIFSLTSMTTAISVKRKAAKKNVTRYFLMIYLSRIVNTSVLLTYKRTESFFTASSFQREKLPSMIRSRASRTRSR